ncbi:barstar family protein [Cellulosimicrobium sp. PMB13]|uniref:barstar family protein n=1 Tax=Cellulosimicrobium sp. PMB13 TaxID=3120158 RepID=UPI003F4BEB4D
MSGTFFRITDGVTESPAGRILLQPGVSAVVMLDVDDLRGEYEIFDAFDKGFRFPVYFGWNWDALYDCLSDLQWMPADRYLVLVKDAERLCLAEGHPHRLLIETLHRVARFWASPIRQSAQRPAGFTVLLSRSAIDDLARRLQNMGVTIAT